MSTSALPILDTVAACRAWRQAAFDDKKSVGFVPTMGALHDGHMSLVRRSLAQNDLTLVSIFVNPAQFAPHEDLTTYPRTLAADLALLGAQRVPAPVSAAHNGSRGGGGARGEVRTPSAVFLPGVQDLYPRGISQDVAAQKGAFVEMAGYSHQMEGASRPTFLRGVATVVVKLFNVVQPTHAYFGQKDIQQALLLRKLAQDLLLPHPAARHVHVVPTARDPADGLALSSRNAYLSPQERAFAGTLYRALRVAEDAWARGATKACCVAAARDVVARRSAEAAVRGVGVRLDYVEMNDSETFEVLDGAVARSSEVVGRVPVILSGAFWVGETRLIDNIVVGDLSDLAI